VLDDVRPLRVMVIEEDEAVGTALLRGLLRQGWLVVRASTAHEALQLREEFQPEFVLLALDLPDMTNAALLARLTQRNDCGVVALSGQGDHARHSILALGAHDFMEKPVTLRDLGQRLRAVLLRFGPGSAASV
jgi:two-component system response regulator RegX3